MALNKNPFRSTFSNGYKISKFIEEPGTDSILVMKFLYDDNNPDMVRNKFHAGVALHASRWTTNWRGESKLSHHVIIYVGAVSGYSYNNIKYHPEREMKLLKAREVFTEKLHAKDTGKYQFHEQAFTSFNSDAAGLFVADDYKYGSDGTMLCSYSISFNETIQDEYELARLMKEAIEKFFASDLHDYLMELMWNCSRFNLAK